MKKRIIALFGIMVMAFSFVNVLKTEAVFAACGGVETNIIDCNNDGGEGSGVFAVLNVVLQVLTWGIGIAGTIGIIVTGIQYMTAKDDAAQMAKAKNRLIQIIIGLAVYAVMWAFLQWLLPGGVFGK